MRGEGVGSRGAPVAGGRGVAGARGVARRTPVRALVLAGLLAHAAPVRAEGAGDAEALTLAQAVALAQAKTRQAIHARDDVLLADAAELQARSFILPQVDLQLTAAAVHTDQSAGVRSLGQYSVPIDAFSGTNPAYAFSLNAHQLIWDGGRWWAVIARAKAGSEQAKAALAGVESDVRLAVAQRYYELAKAERATTTYEQQITIDEEQLARVRAVLEAGRGKLADVAAVERNLAEDRITLARRRSAARAAARALNLALGCATDAPLRLALPAELEAPLPEGTALPAKEDLAEAALRRRPELAAARATLDASRRSVDVARADYFPKLGLSASYARSLQDTSKFFGNPAEDFTLTLGAVLSWSLFSGFATSAAVETAELDLHKQEASATELERSILGEVDEKRDQVALLLDVHRLASEAVRAGEEAVRLARGLYEAGKGTLLELRDAELKLTLERLAVSDARLDLEIAREELRRAVGSDAPLEDVRRH